MKTTAIPPLAAALWHAIVHEADAHHERVSFLRTLDGVLDGDLDAVPTRLISESLPPVPPLARDLAALAFAYLSNPDGGTFAGLLAQWWALKMAKAVEAASGGRLRVKEEHLLWEEKSVAPIIERLAGAFPMKPDEEIALLVNAPIGEHDRGHRLEIAPAQTYLNQYRKLREVGIGIESPPLRSLEGIPGAVRFIYDFCTAARAHDIPYWRGIFALFTVKAFYDEEECE